MGVSVKPIINKPEIKKKICTTCKYRGHLAPDCWGKCEFCGRFGHKSQVCHSKPQQPEPVKKTSKDKNKPKSKKKKTTKKENAKRVAELIETMSLNSPILSEDESLDSDSSSSVSVNRVQLQQVPQTRRERRANAYTAEISDTEVINSLNRTKMASIIKIKKAKTAKGMSYTDGMVSNRLDFRSARIERLILDSGAQVNIVGEAIARDAKVKIIKLK